MDKKLVMLSGPSCVGKGPLKQALMDLHPEIKLAEPVWCHSRRPRFKKGLGRHEVHGLDYYFLPRTMIEQFDRSRYIVASLRSDIQALDMAQVVELFGLYDIVFTEIYYTFLDQMYEWIENNRDQLGFDVRSVMLLPLSFEEVDELVASTGKSPEDAVYDVMIKKQYGRGEDPPEKMEERARNAWKEMQYASRCTHVIVNHAGEDDKEEWAQPLGAEASTALDEFVKVFKD